MQGSDYRRDIDGLRAIAVLLVTFFHINEELIPGGFVGVDVFFVISGYLITGNIVRETRRGTFTFSEFYRRRIRRILPAMFAVTLVSLAVGTAILLPEDVEHLAWSALATSFSGANIFFTYFLDTSYFAADSATVPLLHMWSLGVEEQFYFVWPMFLLAALMLKRGILIAFAAIIVSSIAFGEWQLRSGYYDWSYYMLPSRAFQLAAGGALVFLPTVSRGQACFLAPIGLGLVFGSAFLLDGSSAFPGVNAVPVTLGVACLLAAGVHHTAASKVLTVAPLRAIGLISYSLYLWHWPVLAFQRYFYGELDPIQQALSFVTMSGLAVASYYLFELPFRSSAIAFHRAILNFFIAPTALIGAAALWLNASDGYGPFRYTDYPSNLASVPAAEPAFKLNYVCQRPRLRPIDITGDACVVGDGAPRVLLYGDSNAAHYIGVVGELANEAGVSFRNYAHSACAPIISDPTPFISTRYRDSCIASQALAAGDIDNYDIVFLGGSWGTYAENGKRSGDNFAEALTHSVKRLVDRGIHVILLDTVPVQDAIDARCGRKALKLKAKDCLDEGSWDEPSDFTQTLHAIADQNTRVSVLSVRTSICQSGRCPAFDADGTALYFDRSHLSAAGSSRVGLRYLQTTEATDIISVLRSVDGR